MLFVVRRKKGVAEKNSIICCLQLYLLLNYWLGFRVFPVSHNWTPWIFGRICQREKSVPIGRSFPKEMVVAVEKKRSLFVCTIELDSKWGDQMFSFFELNPQFYLIFRLLFLFFSQILLVIIELRDLQIGFHGTLGEVPLAYSKFLIYKIEPLKIVWL